MTSTISPDETQRGIEQPANGRAGAITAPLGPVESQKPTDAGQTSPKPAEPWLRLSALVALGGISGIAYYLGFVRPYLLTTYYAKPLQDLAKINGHSAPSANEWGVTW